MTRLSGVLRVDARRARLDTAKGLRTLIPYPREATRSRVAITKREMEAMGEKLFGYLAGQEVVIAGDLVKAAVFNARVAKSRLSIADVRLSPESKDKFAREIRRFFKRDPSAVARKLNDAGIRTVSALYHRIRDDDRQEVPAFAEYLDV